MTEKDLIRLPQMINAAILRSVKRWVQKTVNVLKKAAPVGTTGALRDSIRGEVAGAFPHYTAKIAATTDSATWTEHGTKPHGINPRVKRGLRWTSGKGSVSVFPHSIRRRGRRLFTGRWVVMGAQTVKGAGSRFKRSHTSAGWRSSGRSGGKYYQSAGRSGGAYGTGRSLVTNRWVTGVRQFAVWHPGTTAMHWFLPRIQAAASGLPGEIRLDVEAVLRAL